MIIVITNNPLHIVDNTIESSNIFISYKITLKGFKSV